MEESENASALVPGFSRVYPGELTQQIQALFLGPRRQIWVLAQLSKNPPVECQAVSGAGLSLSESYRLAWLVIHLANRSIAARAKNALRVRWHRLSRPFRHQSQETP